MWKWLKKTGFILAGSSLALSGTVAATAPDMTLVRTIVNPVVNVGEYTIEPNGHIFAKYASGTDEVIDVHPTADKLKNLKIVPLVYSATAEFKDMDGAVYKEDVPLTTYVKMGKKDGIKENPTKLDLMHVFSVPVAEAAVSLASTTNTCNTTATSCTVAVIIPVASANPGMVWSGAGDVTSDLVSGVTYNGAAFTKVGSQKVSTRWESMWYLTGVPTAGSNNLVVTNSSSGYINDTTWVFTGVHQTDFKDGSKTGGDSACTGVTTCTISVTTSADQDMIIEGSHHKNFAPTAGTDTTDVTAGGNNWAMKSSALRSTGSNSIQESMTGSDDVSIIAMGVKAASGGAVATPATLQVIFFDE